MLLLMLLIVVVFQIIASKSNLRVSKRLNIVDSVPVFLFFPSRGGGIQSAFFICIKHVPTQPSFIVEGLGLNFTAVTSANNIVYGKTLTIYGISTKYLPNKQIRTNEPFLGKISVDNLKKIILKHLLSVVF